MTPKGVNATKKAFDNKKAMFIAARAKHLAAYKKMGDDYISKLNTMVAAWADGAAEGMSAGMLMARLGLNAFKKWGCTFAANGTMLEINATNCKNMEDPAEWFKNNGKNINKDVVKNMIKIGLAV